MASEVSRTFDLERAAVHVGVKDELGRTSRHTIYVAQVDDVDGEVAKRMTEADAQAAIVRERMERAGWKA